MESGTDQHAQSLPSSSSRQDSDADFNTNDHFKIPSIGLGLSSLNDVEETGRKKRKRRRSKFRENFKTCELANLADMTDTNDNDIEADAESSVNSPSTSIGGGLKNKKRKKRHHSHPQRNGRLNLRNSDACGSESDVRISPQSPQRSSVSSVSDTEDFELIDDFRNLYASARLFEQPPGGLRPIAIDGCNVAFGHGNGQEFSYKGICLAADYFRSRGHKVKAFVPRQHQHLFDKKVVDEMVRDEILVFTPSRNPGNQGKRITAYDDRYIVQYSVITGAIVISNDNFHDLWLEQPAWRDTINNRILQHTWVSKIREVLKPFLLTVKSQDLTAIVQRSRVISKRHGQIIKKYWGEVTLVCSYKLSYNNKLIIDTILISKDVLMFQMDPMGRRGQSLDQFLRFPADIPSIPHTNLSTTPIVSGHADGSR